MTEVPNLSSTPCRNNQLILIRVVVKSSPIIQSHHQAYWAKVPLWSIFRSVGLSSVTVPRAKIGMAASRHQHNPTVARGCWRSRLVIKRDFCFVKGCWWKRRRSFRRKANWKEASNCWALISISLLQIKGKWFAPPRWVQRIWRTISILPCQSISLVCFRMREPWLRRRRTIRLPKRRWSTCSLECRYIELKACLSICEIELPNKPNTSGPSLRILSAKISSTLNQSEPLLRHLHQIWRKIKWTSRAVWKNKI